MRRIAVARTWLAMHEASELRPGAVPRAHATLRQIALCSVADWRRLYRDIGGAWHWVDRDAWPDERLAARLADPRIRIFDVVVERGGAAAASEGFLELERHDDGAVEIVYLGLADSAMGLGLGAWLVERAVREAFDWGATRVWLTTCSLDARSALPNYLRRGFRPWRGDVYEVSRP